MAGYLAGKLAVYLAGCLDIWPATWLSLWLTGWQSGCLSGCLAGYLAVWLAIWLTGYLAGYLAGWLAGWLSGRLAVCLSGWQAIWLAGLLAWCLPSPREKGAVQYCATQGSTVLCNPGQYTCTLVVARGGTQGSPAESIVVQCGAVLCRPGLLLTEGSYLRSWSCSAVQCSAILQYSNSISHCRRIQKTRAQVLSPTCAPGRSP